ncbi:MAG: hypothetical protein NTW87_31340, partial [Planctomycetota bacterium]|nr:hypothetical protein [Planctomycetota bacterium]
MRLLAPGHRVLLSRDGAPLAVAQVRPVSAAPGTDGAERLMSVAAAQEALRAAGAGAAVLQADNEQIRDVEYPIPKSAEQDRLSVILRARKAAAGARLLFSSAFTGPSREDLVPGEKLPLPALLELAVQFFPDASGALPEATFVDNVREPAPLAPLGGKTAKSDPRPPAAQPKRRARAWTFETKKDYRVTIARSGPADWSLQRLPDAVLLTAQLLPDPRQPAEFGPFVVYLGAGPDDAPPEISPLKLDRKETPARDFVEGAVRVYANGANPFVLAETAVVAEIACPPRPDGDVPIKRLPCFFWEAPAPAPAEGEFRFRFAPPVEGIYGVRIAVVAATGQARGEALSFRAGPPASAGFVKVRAGERQFRLDDGSVFIPAGAEFLAARAAAVEETRAHFIELARRGGNAGSISITPSGLPLEGPDAGRFDPDVADALDQILGAAQARDIRLLVFAEHGAAISRDSASHPYFREKNGPLSATPEFFRNVTAKKLFQNRLTYLAARYSAYRSVLSWALMDAVDLSWPALQQNPDDPKLKPNEVDLARHARRDVQEWAEEMALHLKGMDGHEHPVCISISLGVNNPWMELGRVEHLDWTMVRDTFPSAAAWTEAEPFRDEIAALRAWATAVRQPGWAHRPFLVVARSLNLAAEHAPRKLLDDLPADARVVFAHNSLLATIAGGLAGPPMLQWDAKDTSSRGSLTAASVFASVLAAAAEAEGKDELRTVDENLEAPGKVPLRVLG